MTTAEELIINEGLYFMSSFEDLVPSRPIEHLGNSDLTFDGRLPTPGLKIWEDGGEVGCGGKIWIAGELLSKYLLDTGLYGKKKVIEIGSGTGLTGLSLGLSEKRDDDMKVYITDIEELVPLMQKNIHLNNLENHVFAETLSWGEELPDYAKSGVDVILAADCVYLEKAFPLLEKTLLDLSEADRDVLILMSYRKRRKADSKFFRKIKKNFDVIQIEDFKDYDFYKKQSVNLFQMKRKPVKATFQSQKSKSGSIMEPNSSPEPAPLV
ncbi:hypothetical protein WICPIJ_003190 [Wickerhamomyces pijperi]|uniref:Protein-lysine N-methyltransferase EFM6 n=1 Tax=Wickerhamomyces pijperi TaxID=599730 RepID=A0A9P8TNX8_WICPI|nr:hypothetical protein WICPIJ_003190 [Wickerhamomyces pijperi]